GRVEEDLVHAVALLAAEPRDAIAASGDVAAPLPRALEVAAARAPARRELLVDLGEAAHPDRAIERPARALPRRARDRRAPPPPPLRERRHRREDDEREEQRHDHAASPLPVRPMPGKIQREDGAARKVGSERDLSPVRVDDPLRDREPEPGALRLRRLEER